MTKDIVILDLFSGIGGFSKGLSDAGFNIKTHYFSEIDKHAIAVYKHNFKNAIYAGSVTTVRGTDIERPNIITFGSPCQDFSLAGKRAGMEGERSSLILHAMRLIDECRPDFYIWENVKGAFSSNNGADFWAIIQAFANIGGYRLEWQLLNTSWVLPQNRERIYLIGHLAVPGRSFRPVFPFAEDGVMVSKPFREETKGMSRISVQPDRVASALNQRMAKMGVDDNYIKVRSATSSGYEEAAPGDSINFSVPNSATRRGRVGKGVAQTLDTQSNQAVIVGNLKGECGHNVNNVYSTKGIDPTVRENHGKITPVLLDNNNNQAVIVDANSRIAGWHENENVIAAHMGDAKRSTVQEAVFHKPDGKLTAMGVAHIPKVIINNDVIVVAQRGRNPENPTSRKSGEHTEQMLEPRTDGLTNTLTSVQKDNYVIQLNPSKESGGQQPYQQNRVYDANGISTALDQAAGKWSIAIGTWRTHKDGQGFREVKDNNSPTIPARAREDGSGQPVISIDAKIRRLTEIECERLQGFPDNWTALGDYDGVVKPVPQTQRYKQCGNAVTVDIVQMIGERLLKYTNDASNY